MCACRQNKSFRIDDILKDIDIKQNSDIDNVLQIKLNKDLDQIVEAKARENTTLINKGAREKTQHFLNCDDEPKIKFQSVPKFCIETTIDNKSLIESNVGLRNIDEKLRYNLDHRRHTLPLCPMPINPSTSWPLYRRESINYPIDRHSFGMFNEHNLLNNDHNSLVLKNQLANRFLPSSFSVRHPYGLDRANWCPPLWSQFIGRRKGGQVRFSTAQTGALERRFGASKYLSPDERRALAASLRLSDRQVKTWFQNRRAKWRRTTPESAEPSSPSTVEDCSDGDDIDVAGNIL